MTALPDGEARQAAIAAAARALGSAQSGAGMCGTTSRRYRTDPRMQAGAAVDTLIDLGWEPPGSFAAGVAEGREQAAQAIEARSARLTAKPPAGWSAETFGVVLSAMTGCANLARSIPTEENR